MLENLNESYVNADYERNKALLEKSKYTLTENELSKKEAVLLQQKEFESKRRRTLEDKKVGYVKRKLEKQKEMETEKVRVQEEKSRNAIEQAKQTRHIASQFLRKTLKE